MGDAGIERVRDMSESLMSRREGTPLDGNAGRDDQGRNGGGECGVEHWRASCKWHTAQHWQTSCQWDTEEPLT